MEVMRRQRQTLRGQLTRTVNEVEVELRLERPDHALLRDKMQKLDDIQPKVLLLDEEILKALLLAECTVVQQDEEALAAEEYEDKVRTTRRKIHDAVYAVESRIRRSPTPSEAGASVSVTRKTFKLPKIELKKFSGNLTDWLGWWAQFQKIDEDDELDDSDKFQYLIHCMVPGSRARDLVERYPQSRENYPKVIDALKDRFGKSKLLKQVYVRELIKMIINKGQDGHGKSPLTSLYDKLESHLRSLESLGVTFDQMVDFLFPMVESCLPEDILVAWQRSPFYGRNGSAENPPKGELDFLMEFLKLEIESEEQRTLAMAGFGLTQEKKKSSFIKNKSLPDDDVPTAAGLFSGQSPRLCIFCDKQHESEKCIKAQVMSKEQKESKIKNKNACFSCLKIGHLSKFCKTKVKCIICGGKHTVLLCPERSVTKVQSVKTPVEETTLAGLNCTSEVALQTLMVKIQNLDTGKEKLVRALIDSGSQRSYILKATAEELGSCPIKTVTLNHSLFGGSEVPGKVHKMFKIGIHSTVGKFLVSMKALDQDQICGTIPRVGKGPWLSELKLNRIRLNDLDTKNSREIQLLIGADNVGRLLTGKVIQLSNGLTAVETSLGWTLMGEFKSRCPKKSNLAMSVISMNIISAKVSELWSLEIIGIQDSAESKSRQEQELAAKKYFMETVGRDEDGRYSVRLPWIDGKKEIPNNLKVAEKRLISSTGRLTSSGRYSEYGNIFKAWEEEGIISVCDESDMYKPDKSGCHYLPHRAVFKPESKTTPVRPVFDASCKNGRSPSLNNCLEKGPNLLELIPSILLRFRMGKIGVISDIRKAFLMIKVKEEDRDYLRFLWWEDPQTKIVKSFRHNRVVFGMNCSPFLLGAVIEFHLDSFKDHRRPVAEKLLKSLYVDNCVASVNSYEEYDEFKHVATQLMSEAKMELRQWECSRDSSSEVLTSVLGLKWDKADDTIFCGVIDREIPEKITKRVILSQVQKIFDPLGFLCPAVLCPKLMLQKLWAGKGSWDTEVPEEMKLDFGKWWTEISQILEQIKIPRSVTGGEDWTRNVQIHTFSDASKDAFATVVFIRVESSRGIKVQLLQAKSRVAPMKKVTIPRLELLSCTIGARLTKSIKEALSMVNVPTCFWTDSTTTLAWIKRNDDWGTFVGNRVKEICSISSVDDWKHVPGVKNPADLPSRGCSPRNLLKSKWWEGPEWLKLSPSEWPSGDGKVDEDLVVQEKKKGTVMMMTSIIQKSNSWWLLRSSSYSKNLRIAALVFRYVDKLWKKSEVSDPHPTQLEINEAESRLFKLLQQEVFPGKDNVISGLKVVRDKTGIIRVVSKLVNRQDTEGFRFPILLPSTHPLVDLMIREEHVFNCHGGVQFLMGKIREKCWIIQGRRAIRKVVKSCVICRRFAERSPSVPPAALPEDRVKSAKAFEVTGIDLAGPLVLKDKSKVWIVLFSCGVYRCVHLELVQSLSTEDFLMAFVRLSKRKRRPEVVYTDNGTNFTGSVSLFKSIDWKEVERRTKDKRINWKFNPPSAPWWGGWWERLIRSVKDQLKRMLGSGKLTYVQLETCLCEVEAVINGRPLTYVTEDQDDLIPLTPAMFIHDLPESECPEAKLIKVSGFQRKYRHLQQLMDELGSRFRKEYLGQLVQRGKDKKFEDFKVGDVVLVGADNKKRIEWCMAKILELFPGKDGNCRVARVKTASGELIRPLQRLYPLEVSSQEDPVVASPMVKPIPQNVLKKAPKFSVVCETRKGRQVRTPSRYSY